jgi:hypothetical protein
MTAHILYGVGIYDALERKDTTLQELLVLREHAHAVLQAQGDLHGAVQRLEAEIQRRQGK